MGGKPAAKTAFEDISTALKWTVTALTFVTLGVPGLIAKLVAKADDVVVVWRVLALTAPFSIWLALTIVVAVRSKIPPYGQLFLSVGALAALTLLGNAIGAGKGVSLGHAWDLAHGQVNHLLGHLITSYALAYGAETFVSALIVGAFLGYAWCRLLAPAPPRGAR
jgi:hypothetical protein